VKSILTLAAVLAVIPTVTQASPPSAAAPAATADELRTRVTQLSNRAETHARQLGLRPAAAARPASRPDLLARQARRLERVTRFLADRKELTAAVDERALPSPRPKTSLPARTARAYAAATRRAVRLGIRRPPTPPKPADARGRREQFAYWHTVSRWLERRSERLRRSERPLSQRIAHYAQWQCIARHESHGTWDISTGNGYYGGLQMDRGFQQTYSPRLYASKGTADNWTVEEQMLTAEKAFASRGFTPWPNTARTCGLL
jgi:hypothetical protein